MKTSSGRRNEGLAVARRVQTLFKASAALGVALTMAFFAFDMTTASAQVGVAAPGHAPQARAQGPVPGQYIVVFGKDVQNSRGLANSLARQHGFSIQFSYEFALKGFSASMPRAAADALANNPNVAYVEQDLYAYPVGNVYLPAGVLRINADDSPEWDVSGPLGANSVNDLTLNFPVDVDIAIIDTGVADDLDLDVFSKTNCSGGNPIRGRCKDGSASDGVGHGTHVAGTAAASGFSQLIGVAPGARIWAVKVFRDDGAGYCSWAIAGVDWVASHAGEIDVANMSIGCSGSSQALKDAIKASTDAGVVYVAAAGNEDADAGTTSPANAPDAITVSAIADYDGIGGGSGSSPNPICEDGDDTFTAFSNHGAVVDIAAPGACVVSVWNDGLLYYASGTSMASPHVAGAAALIHAELFANSGVRPTAAEIRTELFARAIPQSDPQGGYDRANDDDGFAEPMLNLATGPVNDPPTVAITNPLNNTIVEGPVTIAATAGDTDGTVAQVEFFVDGVSIVDPGNNPDSSDPYSLSWDTTTASEGDHTLSATATDDMGGTRTDSITVTVDNVDDPPSVTLTNPGDGDSVNATVNVTASASDDGAVMQVEFFVGATSIGVDTVDDGWSVSWDTTQVPDGPYTVTAEATDDIGQLSSDSVNVTVNNTVAIDTMYVLPMQFKKQGPNLSITVTIRRDDGDGVAEDTDPAAAGADIVDVLLTNLDTGETWFDTTTLTADSGGKANYKLLHASSGEYEFRVNNVILDPQVWSPGSIAGDQSVGTFTVN